MLSLIQAKRRSSRDAFTLIELLVVIVVIAVLAAIVIPKFSDQGKRSKESALKSDLALLRNAVSMFQADTMAYPNTLSDLTATSAPANGKAADGSAATINATDWHGPYLQGALPTDPISGNAFNYSTTSGSVGQVTSSAGGAYASW